MKNVLKMEVRRALGNYRFFAALAAGLFLVFWHFIQFSIPYMAYQEVYSNGYMLYPHNVYERCMLGDIYGLQVHIFALCLPVLAALPFGASAYEDTRGGYDQNILSRTDRKYYFTAKCAAAFLSGALVVLIPVLTDFLLNMCLYPTIRGDITTGWDGAAIGGMLPEFYYAHPFFYTLMIWSFIGLFGGIYAVMALSVSRLASNVFIVLLFPALIQMFYNFTCSLADVPSWETTCYFDLAQSARYMRAWKPLCVAAGFLALSLFMYGMMARKKDVLDR